jgi:LPS-assembly lipoprotein
MIPGRSPRLLAYVLGRRGLGAASLGCLLGGCGFRPLYGDIGPAGSPVAQENLAAISVGIIPERSGQLLRQALQERFERFGADVPRRYALRASFSVAADAIGVTQASVVTRIRDTGYAQYTLVTLDAAPRTVTSGNARRVDGYDVVNDEFFAADLEQDQVVRRLAEAVADQIALQLALYFDHHGAA